MIGKLKEGANGPLSINGCKYSEYYEILKGFIA
jgi:hypothetical protein